MKLGAVCEVRSGMTLRNDAPTTLTGGVRAIQISDISDGKITTDGVLRIHSEKVSARHLVLPGDVLFRSRGAQASACAVPDALEEPLVAIMPLFIIRAVAEVLDARYLAWYLNQPPAQKHFTQGAAGTSVRMISKPVLENVELEIPPLDIQQAIGTVADLAAQERDLSLQLADRRHDLLALTLAATARVRTERSSA